jgi:hypothetical protein
MVTRTCTSFRHVFPSWPPKMKTLVPTRAAACPTRAVGVTPFGVGSVQNMPGACKTKKSFNGRPPDEDGK